MSSGQPKLFIATPTTNGIMLSDYVNSVVQMVGHLHAKGIGADYRTVDGPNLVMQRDILADDFLRSDCTHLLFIDSDMSFEPALGEKLLRCAKPLIGTIYSKRALDLGKLRTLASRHDFDQALALSHEWCVRFLGPRLEVRDGLCRVEGIGFGFTLIERACFLGLAQDCPTYEGPHGTTMRAFFREMNAGPGGMLDLDYSFCKRWIDRGGDVWAYVDADIRHVGDFRYGVPFSAYLAALQTSRAPEARPGASGNGGGA